MIRVTPPIHLGEILCEEFLAPLDLAPYSLAKALGVPRTRIERLAREETAITPDTALRLARYFGTTPEFWMNLQTAYDITREETVRRDQIEAITPRNVA
jgi:antitoxin HigA-1